MSNWGGKREGAGRPAGKSTKTKAREALEGYSEEIITKLMEQVRKGDSGALKLAVERLIAIPRDLSTSEITELPPVNITAFEVVVDDEDSKVLG